MPPKRSVSMRRAYTYVFKRERSPGTTTGANPQDKREVVATTQRQEKVSAEHPRSPATRIEYLERQLRQSRADAVEARELAISQDADIANLEERMRSLEQEYARKEEVLRDQKAKIEENMVNIVLEQIRTAREGERAAADAENKAAKDAFEHKYKARVAILTQELENARSAKAASEEDMVALRTEKDSLSNDLEKAKDGLKEATQALQSLQSSSDAAISQAQQNQSTIVADYDCKVALLTQQLKEAESGLQSAQSKGQSHAERYDQLTRESARSAADSKMSLNLLKQQMESQVNSHRDQLAKLESNLVAATAGQEDFVLQKSKTDAELASAQQEIEEHRSQLVESRAVATRLQQMKGEAAELRAEVESFKALSSSQEEQIVKLLEAASTHATTQQLLQQAELRSETLTKELEAAIGDTKALHEERAAREALNKDNAALRNKLTELEASAGKLVDLETSFKQQAMELEAARAASEATDSKFADLRTENADLAKKIAAANAASVELQHSQTMADEERATLVEQLRGAQAQGSNLAAMKEELVEAEAAKEAAHSSLRELQEKLMQAERNGSAMGEQLSAISDAKASLNTENAKLNDDIQSAKASNIDLHNKIKALGLAQSTFEQEAATKAKESAATIASLEQEIAAAHAAAQELRSQPADPAAPGEELEELRAQLSAKDSELADLKAWRAKTELELEELVRSPQSVDESFKSQASQSSAEELEDLRAQLMNKDAELAELRAWRKKTELDLDDLVKTPRSADTSFDRRISQATPSKTDAATDDTPPITPAAIEEADPNDVWAASAKKGKKGKKVKSKKNSLSSPVVAPRAEANDS
ncbi:uncharacterized protein AB675_11342 [Cyphellophora attinorum]|uniref:Uncharacterized protein n=1 Tax=Cyphellophora attinorum TaxID=1664694 RepID=A0A0N1H428_9EURO|nr:uncharacterized protein AB675_11342 [Phialophora attinorum]KPI39964.1 hypothetical protein AB675_11342 [Phialophora attinorum]